MKKQHGVAVVSFPPALHRVDALLVVDPVQHWDFVSPTTQPAQDVPEPQNVVRAWVCERGRSLELVIQDVFDLRFQPVKLDYVICAALVENICPYNI